MPLLEHLVVEEMPERTMTDVVQESRDSERLLNQCWGRRVGEGNTERRVDAPGEETREMHGTQEMGESRMFGAGEYPPGRLQLVNAAETLQPDRVEELTLARLTGPVLGDLYVAIERIGD
jgi:hypothetical protein